MSGPYYIMPGDRLPLQGGAPVLITKQQYRRCCYCGVALDQYTVDNDFVSPVDSAAIAYRSFSDGEGVEARLESPGQLIRDESDICKWIYAGDLQQRVVGASSAEDWEPVGSSNTIALEFLWQDCLWMVIFFFDVNGTRPAHKEARSPAGAYEWDEVFDVEGGVVVT